MEPERTQARACRVTRQHKRQRVRLTVTHARVRTHARRAALRGTIAVPRGNAPVNVPGESTLIREVPSDLQVVSLEVPAAG